MLPHKVKRHRSATAIVREFLGPQLRVIPEELVWVPAHPSFPDDGGFSYEDMLKSVRQQRHWAFVRVPADKKLAAVVHYYAAADVPLTDVAQMLGHELGHISGEILDDEADEEERADRYGSVAAAVLKMVGRSAARPPRQPVASSKPRTPKSTGASRRRGR